ncbi:Ecm9p NDAI_0K02000 [Naumovozyma dairenensis CBS 421]|uniref:Uncharacterized protein n=1 Tax=Naumovozyma dairenensis (strain ATCC 10597 / BCRC 20456 / CBS 421 / NBRC 0211 / NRRL Y-12639) TaxID=1071378 RepID=G0WHY0_NAUDC|nr:hypothetical protein NDAI_0K02000 [Naumovozyma dairenensis CBS 421]CCD27391.1 hypothetical protein NDAI_0K02000 [Naumovozyma dairenensis CBS 421]
MTHRLTLCKELFELLIDEYPQDHCILTIAPDQQNIKSNFYVDKTSNHSEVICFKGTYLRILKEAHDYFNEFINFDMRERSKINRKGNNNAEYSYWNTYYMTIGMFLCTPEHKTIFTLHEEIFIKLLQQYGSDDDKAKKIDLLNKELKLIQRFLSSENNRLNKSSSMWHYYKKLYVINQLILSPEKNKDNDYIMTFFHSLMKHPTNYYSWNTMRWFFDNIDSMRMALFEKVKRYCFQHSSNCSSWSALAYFLNHVGGHEREISLYHRLEFKRLWKHYDKIFRDNDIIISQEVDIEDGIFSLSVEDQKYHPQPVKFNVDIKTNFNEILEIIELLRTDQWPPFLCLFVLLKKFEIINRQELFDKWRDEIRVFQEETHLYIPYQYNKPFVPEGFTDDLLIARDIMFYGFKKTIIEEFDDY